MTSTATSGERAREPQLVTGWRRLMRAPLPLHLLSLLLSGVFIVIAARNQWFFFDEWAFLVPRDDSVLAPHVGHWSTTPIAFTRLVRAVFGLTSYWPYLIPAILVHLGVAHALWRILRRIGVRSLLATALATLFSVLGAAAENILWAFQIGFMGAILLGLVIVLLVARGRAGTGTMIAVISLSIWSLTFSGTAIPVLLAGGLVALHSSGWRRTAVMFAPSAVVYLGWYTVFARESNPGYGPQTPLQVLVEVPEYVGHYLVDGLQAVVPIVGFGAVIAFAIVAGVVLTIRTAWSRTLPAYALFAAAALQALLTALSRMALGTEVADSGRYVYALVALLLPICGLLLERAARNSTSALTMVIALVGVAAVYNAGLLYRAAAVQSAIEGATEQRLYAALDLADRSPEGTFDPALRPEPVYAPDVTLGDLQEMERLGWLAVGAYDSGARLSVLLTLEVVVAEVPDVVSTATCTTIAAGTSSAAIDGPRDVYLFAEEGGSAVITLVGADAVSDPRTVDLADGWIRIESQTGERLAATSDDSDLLYCNE